jgi:pyrimidine-nucleoside phosphorylase/thymidine phosphorylase
MRAVDVLKRKREGRELSREEIAFLVNGFTAGEIPDYQVSAFLMAVCLRGMSAEETVALTETMLRSGAILDFGDVPGPKIDKHSTGGVGDKTSLIIAPLAAAAGAIVPMISGRGLGHSGGTLDKLESIPGFDVRLDEKRFHQVVSDIGFAMVGQTEAIAPADRKLYSLRDVTATVESFPLITGSILSKKLAEGIEGLVLDVKVGSGAFMKTREDAETLARSMLSTAARLGTKVVALLTDMSQPLGTHVGNALEVEESLALLRDEGPADLRKLCLRLTAHMLVLGGIASNVGDGERRAEEELRSGRGLAKFLAMVRAQGGDPRIAEGAALPRARARKEVAAAREGFVTAIDTEKLGTAAMVLGAGREKVEDVIDPGAGLVVRKKLGDEVDRGDPLVTLHYNDPSRLSEAEAMVRNAYSVSDAEPPSGPELILAVLEQ